MTYDGYWDARIEENRYKEESLKKEFYYIKDPMGNIIKNGSTSKKFHNKEEAITYLKTLCPVGFSVGDLLDKGYTICHCNAQQMKKLIDELNIIIS